ncbi:GMP reductase [Fructobacillus ficulneus]|uniref:GMP reductase n=1 Tax=Fructobacillus ficulneus TaxID=157463 RepID=A0A0K8MIA9_9LACO|nr:GMP reductase [Fructobacillus ficulneus]GAP00291.1 guanosine 5'-monophosphate oxidoreductase [Fructobacillus ficulneus]
MKTFDYDAIRLLPKKSVLKSRRDADTSVVLGDHSFKLPVMPANMATVIDEDLAVWLASHGYFYVMHRFQPETRFAFVQKLQGQGLIASISMGITDDEYALVDQFVDEGVTPEYITIDVAHGHSDYVIKMVKYIKENLPKAFLIVGNLGTPEGVVEIEAAGADATKVGIGPGKACITKDKTGFGTNGWQLAAIAQCAQVATKPIIGDGGIRHNGDIAKSIRFGATMVMVGSMFAGHDETPGDIIEENGQTYKAYYGSASAAQKGHSHNVEGRSLMVDYKGPIQNTLTAMEEDLQSAISYAGGRDLSSLKTVDYVVLTDY